MPEWWESLLSKWSWNDPTIILGLAAIVVSLAAIVVTVVLWVLDSRQKKRDSESQAKQAKSDSELGKKRALVLQRQRRDDLPETIDGASDPSYLETLWEEISEYKKEDRDFLLAHLRANPALPLPGTSIKVQDNLTDAVVSLYVDGFEDRYAERDGDQPYPGLLEFIEEAIRQDAKIEESRIVDLVTGPTAEEQPQNHRFYRDLVLALPQTAGPLIEAVERIDSSAPNGLKLNVLTGALLAIRDMKLRCQDGKLFEEEAEVRALKHGIATALASLLYQGALRSFDEWEFEGSTERMTATAAWLIRAVGWVADADSLQSTWMIENLASAIESDGIRDWGTDNDDVRQGFKWIREKCPKLWETYGEELETAATKIGPWKGTSPRKISLTPEH